MSRLSVESLPLGKRGSTIGLKLSRVVGVILISGAALLTILLLVVPLAALLWRAAPSWMAGIWQASTVVEALRLSLLTASLATFMILVIGTPVAYLLARHHNPAISLLESFIDLPMVLPPAVAGIALLVAFGRNGLVGRLLAIMNIELPFTTAAVIMAQLFVSAPFFIRAAKAGFQAIDPKLEQVSAMLGANPVRTFRFVTLPLARNALIGGAILSWSRALGEFGATILFAGSFAGRTQTMPLAIYAALQTDFNIALILASILLGTSFLLLTLLRAVTHFLC